MRQNRRAVSGDLPPEDQPLDDATTQGAGPVRFSTISLSLLDRIEQAAVLVLYSLLVSRLWPADFSAASLASIILLISEGAVVVFLLVRRPTEHISRRPGDWLVAAGGTFLPLMAENGGANLFPAAGMAMLTVGTLLHISAKFFLNRSFGLVAANRGVKKEGPYRIVRHPMYAGYMLTHVGFLLAQGSLRNFFLYAALWTILVLRIRAEERVLLEDPAYRSFAEKVRYRLIPGVY